MDAEEHPELTVWLGRLSQGNAQAAHVLWQAYFAKLTEYAKRKLGTLPRRAVDEEDVALSAMHSFCQGAANGKFAQLQGRDDLWKLLLTITARKAYRQLQDQNRLKRGGGQVRGESIFVAHGSDQRQGGLGEVLGAEPTPELAAQVAEDCQRLLGQLQDDELREVARLRLEGYANDEIAQQLGCTTRTVERKLERIRRNWSGSGEKQA